MLRHAYFKDFSPGPTLLIWGEAEDMRRLADAFWAAANENETVTLSDLPDCQSVDGMTVRLETVRRPSGIWRDRADPNVFHWETDPETWAWFAELVEQLCKGPGHQYLECPDDEITVTVSCGEYPPDLKPDD